jgi:uncharacterized protein (TIGR03083 family)
MHALDVLKYGNLTVLHALKRLPDEDWHTPHVCGVWSVREIIAHLASFEYALVDALSVARGQPIGPHLAEMLRDGQAFNDKQVSARAGLSPAETLAEYEKVQAQTMELTAALPSNLFYNTGFLPAYGMEYDLEDFIAYSFYGHKREHAAQVMVFRDGIGR